MQSMFMFVGRTAWGALTQPTPPGDTTSVERHWKGSGRQWRCSERAVERQWKDSGRAVKRAVERAVKGQWKGSERAVERQ